MATLVIASIYSIAGADMMVVDGSNAQAVVVTAATPTPTAVYAASELVKHVEKATGVSLPVRTEADDLTDLKYRIYIGDTKAARQAGVDVDALQLEATALKTADGNLFIVGREHPEANPVDEENQYSGTLFGVYEILERFVGVHWLWPGELGTYVPQTNRLLFPEINEVIKPAMELRRMRWRTSIGQALRRYRTETKQIAFSDQGLKDFAREIEKYVRRHRMGTSLNRDEYVVHGRVGHSMSKWWILYGAEHPEFFMADETGRRGHYDPKSRRVDPCLSNPALHQFIVDEIWDGGDVLKLGSKDHHAVCHCENCLQWDKPDREDPYMTGHIVSNRYARFYKAVYDLAVKKNPNVKVLAYIYIGYFPAPTNDIKLNQNIYLEFVPWGQGSTIWFPTDTARLEWMNAQWLGWKATGAKLGYRPNWELGGYVMPHLNLRQGGESLRWLYANGMTAACMSHLGQFGVRGPEHYMYARLFSKPTLTVDAILREYYSAFGPAGDDVRAYFDFWEEYNHKLLQDGQWSNMWSSPAAAPRQYTPQALAQGEALLQRAMASARRHSNDEFARRVAFLQAGLEHAKLSTRMVSAIQDYVADPTTVLDAQKALRDLISFRREHESEYLSNYLQPVRVERRQYGAQIDKLLSDEIVDHGLPRFVQYEAIQVPAHLVKTDAGPYLGFGWYRTTFNIPGHRLDKPVEIHFGGVDEQAWVYLNGRLIGEHTAESEGRSGPELWDLPFVIKADANNLVDGENLLIVRVHASDGGMGIHQPVCVYQDGQPVDFGQSWEFRRDRDNVGIQDGWYNILPGEDAYR